MLTLPALNIGVVIAYWHSTFYCLQLTKLCTNAVCLLIHIVAALRWLYITVKTCGSGYLSMDKCNLLLINSFKCEVYDYVQKLTSVISTDKTLTAAWVIREGTAD